jgi:hypothetical protein
VSHIPLFIHDPREKNLGGQRRSALTQTTDIMPTILDLFGAEIPSEVTGKSILPALQDDTAIRRACIFGQFGGAVNVTDGRHTYFRYPQNPQEQLYHYTLMPMHMRSFFEGIELKDAALAGPFDFTKGIPVLRLPVIADAKANMIFRYPLLEPNNALYDLGSDPGQRSPLHDNELEQEMLALLAAEMQLNAAPPEAFRRLGLEPR